MMSRKSPSRMFSFDGLSLISTPQSYTNANWRLIQSRCCARTMRFSLRPLGMSLSLRAVTRFDR